MDGSPDGIQMTQFNKVVRKRFGLPLKLLGLLVGYFSIISKNRS